MLNETSQTTPSSDGYCYSEPAKMAPERWEKIRNRVIDEQGKGKTITAIAKVIGEDVDVLTKWLSHVDAFPFLGRVGEKSHAEQIAAALETYCTELDKQRLNMQARCPVRVETSVTRAIEAGVATLRSMCEISYIDAPPGVGKTEGINLYLENTRKAEGFDCPVWMVVLTENDLTLKAVLSKMAWAIFGGETYGDRSDYGVSNAIRRATHGKGGVLLIDEAQHLGDADKRKGVPIINALRSFSDAGCFGIALFGNGEIYRRLRGAAYPQLTSRLDPFRLEIAGLDKGAKGQPALTAQDVLDVMHAWGVSGLGVDKWCLQAAQKPGALRYMTSIFRRAFAYFDGDVDVDALHYIETLHKGRGA